MNKHVCTIVASSPHPNTSSLMWVFFQFSFPWHLLLHAVLFCSTIVWSSSWHFTWSHRFSLACLDLLSKPVHFRCLSDVLIPWFITQKNQYFLTIISTGIPALGIDSRFCNWGRVQSNTSCESSGGECEILPPVQPVGQRRDMNNGSLYTITSDRAA